MAFIETIPPEEATGALAQVYEGDLKSTGAVANHTRALSLRPDVTTAWRALSMAVRAHIDPRRYELITTVVAARLRCSY
ncbi:MAG TPA: hypothetical protein VKV57_00615 [bacterium]|nr:hypothetical protein [bacterium]